MRAESPHHTRQDWESQDGEQRQDSPTALGDPSSSTPNLETYPARTELVSHMMCHHLVLISSCISALDLNPCWHRYLLNNELLATSAEFCLQQAASLDLFCFLSLFINSVCLYAVKQLFALLQSRTEEEGLCNLYFFKKNISFPSTEMKRNPRERQRGSSLLT